MPANNETRTLKSNTLEQLRQKSNEVSLHLGDNSLIDSRILDKTESFTATAGQKLFTSNTLRFETKPEESIDKTTAVAESYNVGVLQVFLNGTELVQGIAAGQFKVPNFAGSTVLSNISDAADISDFVENAVIYQGSSLATATFQGTVLDCTTTLLRLKTKTGAFSASTLIKVDGASDTILGANHANLNSSDSAYGVMIELITAASANDVVKVVSHNIVDAINEVQDDVGDITAIDAGIPLRSDVVIAVNSFKGEVGNATDLSPAANTVVGAINEHETDIGTVANLTTSANDLVTAINEHDTELGTISAAAFGTTASTVSTAIAELHTDVDARLFLTKGSQQTLNSDITFTNGNTLVFPTGSTLDIRNGLLQVGSGGLAVSTAFIDFNSDLDDRGLSFERSDFGNGVDVKLIWDEVYAASQPDRGFRVIGLNTGATTETADLVTFYNAQDLIANNTETGIDVTWDSTNQNFDFALSADPTITLGGDLSGSVELTNLTSGTLTATIGAGTVENSMLAGSIAASKLAGSIGNSKLTNSTITVTDGSNSTAVALGGTLTVNGTSGEIEVAESSGTFTIGLPNNVTVGNNLIVTGNLTVQGTQTILNTSTLEVEDTLVLAGNDLSSEPSSGGFGLEVGPITSPSGVASGVTGAHSIVYNYSTDQWEADGSLILSEATQGVPGVKVSSASNALAEQDLGQNKAIDFNEGSGITILGATSGNDIDVTITNADKGSSQNIFKNVLTDSGTAVADTNNDTLSILGGNDLSTSVSADAITIQHDNSGVTAASYGSQLVVPSITVDARGHITAASSNTAISLSALGYSGVSNADNYGSFSISANGASAEAIGSGETVTFNGGGSTNISRSGNSLTFTSTNTVTSVGTSGNLSTGNITFVGGSNVTVSKSGGTITIAANDDDTITTVGINNSNFTSGNIDFRGANATSVSKSGNVITISSTDTNDNDNTITKIGANNTGFDHGNISFNSGTNITVSKSGASVTITNGITNLNQLTNGPGYVTSSGVTSVTAGNGLSGGTISSTGTIAMSGNYTGTFTATEVCASSDERLKTDIETLDGSKVFDMRGASFKFLADDKTSSGVIAQELEEVAPELIHEDQDGFKSVAYGNTVGYLIEAIKLLKEEIEELKSINKKV